MARTVQYRLLDGSLTTDKSAAIRVSRSDVQRIVSGSWVPESYYQGSAKHETGYVINEVDTEPSGFKSYGIWQISDEEASGNLGEWWTLEGAARVFIPLAEKRARSLAGWAGVDVNAAPVDLWAYLALYHNQGGGAAQQTLNTYGMNWDAYKSRNPGAAINAYGDDCLPDSTPLAALESVGQDIESTLSDSGDFDPTIIVVALLLAVVGGVI